ncbi:acyl-CoA desaturase [Marixanthomonas sp. SCSIO 43207]|uniref:fatty acid desaturase family protein n=1 Tax=Marixanthomonas sp. SCSIO 43207 TaxID=2779360 RepID=UPI001CA90743|nr:acyl-CoA desaturase [Marixanthomonas sp. SCSIO 43207]UAB81446.1 acyl-CoA desaturase [Marixanthomonas sp. SCSIO 43207]
MNTPQVKFSRIDSAKFFRTLNKRVNSYFKENNIKRTGNWKLHLKSVIMFSLYLTPYFLLLTLDVPTWAQILFTIIMGVGMAGVGMNVMHDANHGSYSSKKWINKLMGSSMYILAGNVYNWQVQHNVLHHTYTNIHGHDEDMEAGRVIRFSKHAKWRRFHKFQQYYSVLLYGLLTFNWAITTDFKQTKRYLAKKLAYGKLPKPITQWSILIITKLIYMGIWIVIPILFFNIAWWKILIGFFIMHYVAGLILSIVFQLAHIVEDTEMPLPDKTGNMKNTWAIHQLFTTVNFSTKNKIVNWFTGGLNHQVEHHIFPNISHIHYSKISEIVKQTTTEFNLPYYEYKTTRSAIVAHFKHLKKMGLKPSLSA